MATTTSTHRCVLKSLRLRYHRSCREQSDLMLTVSTHLCVHATCTSQRKDSNRSGWGNGPGTHQRVAWGNAPTEIKQQGTLGPSQFFFSFSCFLVFFFWLVDWLVLCFARHTFCTNQHLNGIDPNPQLSSLNPWDRGASL